MVRIRKLVLVPTIGQIRERVRLLEEAADIMEVRRVLGQAKADQVEDAIDKARAARNHMDQLLREKRA